MTAIAKEGIYKGLAPCSFGDIQGGFLPLFVDRFCVKRRGRDFALEEEK
jgi:hypothetical protein